MPGQGKMAIPYIHITCVTLLIRKILEDRERLSDFDVLLASSDERPEYTGAGKHPLAQLNLAREMGIEVRRGDPRDNRPGARIVIPEHPSQLRVVDVDLDHVRRSYLRNALASLPGDAQLSDIDIDFLAAETGSGRAFVEETMDELRAEAR